MFRRKVGEAVEKGAAIAELYSERSENVLTMAEKRFLDAVVVTDCDKVSTRAGREEGEAGPASEPPSEPPVVDSFIDEHGLLRPWAEYFASS